ncbi:acyl-CoA dehydrogenase family protein [Candidatus Poriferisodalis sp.]|uniref:acyl-CoA dehydrogenase family protein n=1 Tax=Candidatus Poriferisodalis sp. TaxID=3101277 RepID=UPI003D0BDEA6
MAAVDTDAPEITEEQFVAEATEFLEANAKRKTERREFVWGQGPDNAALFEEVDREAERQDLAAAKEWRAKKFDAGYGWITGPSELGGSGLPRKFERLWMQLEGQFDTPDGGFFGIGLGMVAPTILAHANPEVSSELLPRMYRADVVGCQLFSEPGAGSDLASLQMRADRDGEEWILNGQKVWTSGAHYSDVGEVIARTDFDLPKHQGLTGFIVDMDAPGVDVRPLRQMTGGANFNEVYFNDVRVLDSHRLGDVNQGWGVALTTLMNERASIGGGGAGGAGGFTKLAAMAQHFGVDDDALTRQKLMNVYTYGKVLSWSNQRTMDGLHAGRTPGPEMSLAKMGLIRQMGAMCDFVSDTLELRLVADTGEWGTFSWAGYVLGFPAMRIAGGSDEVMRNIVGERVLGLPKEPGIDTTSPFRELKVGTQRSE